MLGEWQPIETAPNDQSILIHYDNGKIELIDSEENFFMWIPYTVKEDFCDKPTHWMPLPNPPSDGG